MPSARTGWAGIVYPAIVRFDSVQINGTLVPMYRPKSTTRTKIPVERVQTGVRLEKRLLKVLKGLAEIKDTTLGDLLEGIVLHAFDGKCPFGAETLRRIAELKKVYGLELDAGASHRLREKAR